MKTFLITLLVGTTCYLHAQKNIPLDAVHWKIDAKAYLFENYKGKDAIYLQNGNARLKDSTFLNGTIEFDVYLTGRRGFPGVTFRAFDDFNYESFYVRPHQSGNPDSNQGISVFNGLSAWQLYHGRAFSSAYTYKSDEWTHIKLVVNGSRAQVFFDYSDTPHLSWYLKHGPKEGGIAFGGGGAPVHYANFSIDKNAHDIIDFNPFKEEKPLDVIERWEVSDSFKEEHLSDITKLQQVINIRKWKHMLNVEDNGAADLSRVVNLFNSKGNTVFAKTVIDSEKNQMKLLKFGYSDRVIVILNGTPIFRGTNKFMSRDYRYLGSIGFYNSVYVNLKKGENTLLFAVSEDFGGWGIMGKFDNQEGIKIK